MDYNAGQACDVVIKVFTCVKTAWNRIRNMLATVLTTITTVWRPGLVSIGHSCLTILVQREERQNIYIERFERKKTLPSTPKCQDQPQKGHTAHTEESQHTPRPIPTNKKPKRQVSVEPLTGRNRIQHPPPPPDADRATTLEPTQTPQRQQRVHYQFCMAWNGKMITVSKSE